MAPRLKVFVTSDGLTDYVVAVSSRAKALAAWGSHQDLFKTGAAHETEDADLARAAMARPGEVLRRAAGSRGQLARMSLPRRKAASGPSKVQLRKIAALEVRLEELEEVQAAARAKLEARRQKLEAEVADLEARQSDERHALESALKAARAARG